MILINKEGKVFGVILTIAVHLAIIIGGYAFGLGNGSYVPPPEEGILIDFSQEEKIIPPAENAVGIEPKARKVSPNNDIELAQRSQSQLISENSAKSDETTVSTDGDVEVPEPPREKEINKRALFNSRAQTPKDTLAPQVAKESSDNLRDGHVDGNTTIGNPENEPSARLQGRSVKGNLPLPTYTEENAGKVVVRIIVDQSGNVINATPGAPGTTVSDKNLWNAAKEAALKAKFSQSSTAPAAQEGTITYIFTLR